MSARGKSNHLGSAFNALDLNNSKKLAKYHQIGIELIFSWCITETNYSLPQSEACKGWSGSHTVFIRLILSSKLARAFDQVAAGTEDTNKPAGFTKSIHRPKLSSADSNTTIILTSSFVKWLRVWLSSKYFITPALISWPLSVYNASTRETKLLRIDESSK